MTEFSQPAPIDDGMPYMAISYLASYALTRREEDRDKIRDTVPEADREIFDRALHVQEVRGIEGHNDTVRERMRIELEKREAIRLADAYEAKNNRKPIQCSLTDELALPDADQVFAIDRLLPVGGNALFAGRYKAGKTTFNANLLRSWVDGQPFLGHFPCHPDPERPVVTIFNYEMTRDQFRRWMRKFDIQNHHNVNAVHLRGVSLPMALPEVRAEIAGWLRDSNTGLWVIDPASRAMSGMDGEKNPDVNVFTGWLDEIKSEAGVRDLVMNIHMTHSSAKEKEDVRALGAQAWSAWGDALWMLTKDQDDCRWFHAIGRDVEEEKMLVDYNADNMNVQLINTDPETMKRDRVEQAVIKVVAENAAGINVRGIRSQAPAFCGGARLVDIDRATDKLAREGVIVVRPGPNRQRFHFIATDHPTLEDSDDE